MKVIVVTHKKSSGGGVFCNYYRLSKNRGVKVLKRGKYTGIKELKESRRWEDAQEEVDIYRQAYSSGVVPKVYGVRVVRDGEYYRAGILMVHLQGQNSHREIFDSYKGYNSVRAYLETKIETTGIRHEDLHPGNIIVTVKGGKVRTAYAIDFSPRWVMVDVSKRERKPSRVKIDLKGERKEHKTRTSKWYCPACSAYHTNAQ